MGRVIGVCNHKGGVGKTTTTVAMGRCLTDLGFKVCLIDVDDSGNPSMSKHLGMEADVENGETNLVDVLDPILKSRPLNRKVLHDSLKRHSEGYYVLPADKTLSALAVSISASSANNKVMILNQVVEPLKEVFDFVILDAAPSLTLLQTNLMAAADEIIIVTQPQESSCEGVVEMIDTLNIVKKELSTSLKVMGVLITMYDVRTNYNKDKADIIMKQLREQGVPVFDAIIPRATVAESWVESKSSLLEYAPNSKPSIAYRKFVDEYLSIDK